MNTKQYTPLTGEQINKVCTEMELGAIISTPENLNREYSIRDLVHLFLSKKAIVEDFLFAQANRDLNEKQTMKVVKNSDSCNKDVLLDLAKSLGYNCETCNQQYEEETVAKRLQLIEQLKNMYLAPLDIKRMTSEKCLVVNTAPKKIDEHSRSLEKILDAFLSTQKLQLPVYREILRSVSKFSNYGLNSLKDVLHMINEDKISALLNGIKNFDEIIKVFNEVDTDKIIRVLNEVDTDKIIRVLNKVDADIIIPVFNEVDTNKIIQLFNEGNTDTVIGVLNMIDTKKIARILNHLDIRNLKNVIRVINEVNISDVIQVFNKTQDAVLVELLSEPPFQKSFDNTGYLIKLLQSSATNGAINLLSHACSRDLDHESIIHVMGPLQLNTMEEILNKVDNYIVSGLIFKDSGKFIKIVRKYVNNNKLEECITIMNKKNRLPKR